MSTATSAVDQEAIRVANRYAALIEKAVTLADRAQACQDAAQQYRRDAQANVESTENHRAAARTIRDVSLSRQHTLAARAAEAEAAREVLAARYYEAQAETYMAQAHGTAPAGPAGAGAGPVLDAQHADAGHYDRRSEQEKPMSSKPAGPAAPPRGHYNPDQPRATDGKWTKTDAEVSDVLGYADGENVHATDRVTGTGAAPTDLALIEYPNDGINQVGAFVSVATSPHGYNPLTGKEDGTGHIYCAPQLGPAEAEATAERLEELAGMVESGFQPPEPTKHTRARQRIELLLQEDRASRRQRISVGEEEDFPLTTGELFKLLCEADPTLSAPQTRHAVRARTAVEGGGEDGTVWLDIELAAGGGAHVVVTAVEGTESPDDDYNRQYAARHTPASARELAAKLRAFAAAAHRHSAS